MVKKTSFFVLLMSMLILWGTVTTTSAQSQETRGKTLVIGQNTWYTEQNSFEDIIQVAREKNKPVLVFFSSAGCYFCREVITNVFENPGFQEIANQFVLLNIERKEKKSFDYLRKNRIAMFPSFKIFSKEGIDLDTGIPKSTVESFLQWINDVKAGNHMYGWEQQLKKEPNNRDLILKIEEKLDTGNMAEKEKLIRQAIAINPDFKDKVSHDLYERIASFLFLEMFLRKGEEEKLEYIRQHDAEFMKIILAYYPDNFQYGLKDCRGLEYLIYWLNTQGQYKKSISYFNDFIKRKGKFTYKEEEIIIYPVIITALLHENREKEAEEWFNKIQDLSKDMDRKKISSIYKKGLFDLCRSFINYYGEKGDIAKAEKYAALIFTEYIRQGMEYYPKIYKLILARDYLLFAGEQIQSLEEELKTAEGTERADIIINLASITAKQGKKDKARQYFTGLYGDKAFFEAQPPEARARLYLNISSAMLTSGLIEKLTLEIAELAVSLDKQDQTLDNLAAVYAGLGDYTAAVKTEEKAIDLAYNDSLLNKYKPKLAQYRKHLSKK